MEHADKRLHVGNVIHFTRLGNIARSHKDVIRQERCFTASEMVLLQEKPSAIVSQYIPGRDTETVDEYEPGFSVSRQRACGGR